MRRGAIWVTVVLAAVAIGIAVDRYFLPAVTTPSAQGGLATKDKIALWIAGTQAFLSLLVVIIAIFGERFRNWLFQPAILVSVGDAAPYIEQSTGEEKSANGATEISRSSSIRMRVTNAGRNTATSCRVVVHSIFVRRDDGTYYLERSISPAQLPWASDEKLPTIAPRVPFFVEVARIEKPQTLGPSTSQAQDGEYELICSVADPGKKGANLFLGRGVFVVPVTIYAENCPPVTEYLQLSWKGHAEGVISKSSFHAQLLREGNVPKEVRE